MACRCSFLTLELPLTLLTSVHGGQPLHNHTAQLYLRRLTDFTLHPHTIPLTLYLVGYPWLELLYFN